MKKTAVIYSINPGGIPHEWKTIKSESGFAIANENGLILLWELSYQIFAAPSSIIIIELKD